MRVSVLSSVSILAVFVLTAGFLTLREPVTVSSDIEIDALAIPTSTHHGQDLASSIPFLSITPAVTVPTCILPGEPSRSERKRYTDCMQESDCEIWREFEDEDNGNIAMVCWDDEEEEEDEDDG